MMATPPARARGALAALSCALALIAPREAESQPTFARLAIVRPGGGILVADGVSVVPLQVVLQGGGPELRDLRVSTSEGRVMGTARVGPRGARFFLAMPAGDALIELTVDLFFEDGTRRTEIYPLVLPKPKAPELRVDVEPRVVSVDALSELTGGVSVGVSAIGEDVKGVGATASDGALALAPPTGSAARRSRSGRLEPPRDLPVDAPSHIDVLGVATSAVGFGATAVGVSVTAPVRVRARIPRGWRLAVRGAETRVKSALAPADGFTTLEDVPIRYGAAVRVFRTRGRRRRELSIPLPAGRVPVGTVAALPDQDWADGGTGPTVAVAIPPDPFGGEPVFPELELEGARVVSVIERGPRVRVLVVERPIEAKRLRVLLDGLPAGEIELRPGRGQSLLLTRDEPRADERAAALVSVLDGNGLRTSAAKPRVRLSRGDLLVPRPEAEGRWRVSVPAGADGARGEEVELVAELPPLPIVVGDALELPRAALRLRLEGLPPALRSAEGRASARAGPLDASAGIPLAFDATVFGGTTFGALRRGGLALGSELRLPVLEDRLGMRLGLELGYGRAEGEVGFDAGPVPATTEVTGLVVPLELTVEALRSPSFILRARAGASLRYEAGAVSVDGSPAGGAGRLGAGLRAGVEGEVPLGGPWRFVFAGLFDGLAASADGLSSDATALTGTLSGVRADVGLRTWLSD